MIQFPGTPMEDIEAIVARSMEFVGVINQMIDQRRVMSGQQSNSEACGQMVALHFTLASMKTTSPEFSRLLMAAVDAAISPLQQVVPTGPGPKGFQ